MTDDTFTCTRKRQNEMPVQVWTAGTLDKQGRKFHLQYRLWKFAVHEQKGTFFLES